MLHRHCCGLGRQLCPAGLHTADVIAFLKGRVPQPTSPLMVNVVAVGPVGGLPGASATVLCVLQVLLVFALLDSCTVALALSTGVLLAVR